jgi:ABC-2 type transport system ATP-binding protein
MIQADRLTKRYGTTLAVHELTFTVASGRVTGFLGPNGAGKTTTMRLSLGLAAPTAGTVTVNGRRYAELPCPMREVGALLDARAVHPNRTAYHHLLCLARSNHIPRRRVEHVLGLVGLEAVARQRAGTFSVGMSQRLGIATALLGDPPVLLFDEPVNGLDPEGIVWIRTLMRDLAGEGRTVLVSSHLMSEMAQTADHLLVIGRGRLIADTSVDALERSSSKRTTLVRTPDTETFADRLTAAGATVRPGTEGALIVLGMDSIEIGKLAAASGVVLFELTPQRTSLEEAFMHLTHDSLQYRTTQPGDG